MLEKKRLSEGKKRNLLASIEDKTKESQDIEVAILKADELAQEIEKKANFEVERILAEAGARVALTKANLTLIEKEIVQAKEELSFYQSLVYDTTASEVGEESDYVDAGAVREGKGVPSATQVGGFFVDPSAYTIQLVSFLNARHYVILDGNQGPIHAHSWQIHTKIKIPPEKSELIPFAKIMGSINSVIACYEKTLLNEQHPFNLFQPATENIAMFFFNRFEDILLEFGLAQGKLSVWETPTKGIEVARRNPEFDNIPLDLVKDVVATAAAGPSLDQGEKMPPSPSRGKKDKGAIRELRLGRPPGTPSTSYSYPAYRYALHGLLITLVTFLAYYQVVNPQLRLHYPWGSDTWGHLYKAEFLFEQLLQGNYFPQFTEYWYSGVQPFRYWAPLSYYVISLLRFISTDIFMAGNYYVFVSALLGGLSLLFFAGRIGIWPATLAGVIWAVWIDNVRVAFSEGNLPRVLSTALLPLLFFLFLKLLEERKKNYLIILLTVLLVHLTILCHAMMGAVYCLSLALFGLFFWAFGGCRLRDLVWVYFVTFVGVISAGWWLLPSLRGGIIMIDPEAVRAAIQFVPAATSLDPFYRFVNRETFYWGVSLLFAFGVLLLAWRNSTAWVKSLVICSFLLIVITFPSMRLFILLMPLSHLLWPLRFSSFASLALIIGSMALYPFKDKFPVPAGSIKKAVIVSLLGLSLLVDCFFSLRLLAYTGAKSYVLLEGTELLKAAPGWRIATIDLSRLGSAPSYLFSETAGRGQVFGWAWQGATTSYNIMLLNMGLEYQYYPFLFRSSVLLGGTDLLVKDDVISEPEVFADLAAKMGYEQTASIDGLTLWRGPVNRPYLVVKKDHTLVIGRHAGTIAIQFPSVEVGPSPYLDRYSLAELMRYPSIVLAGAEWWSKTKAEQLVREYISFGGKVLVELSGLPENILAKQPEFLGIYGETVTLSGQLELFDRGGRSIVLDPFVTNDMGIWMTYVPQGLDVVEVYFEYYGVNAPLLGYKLVEGQKVWFLGGNLSYHTFLTKDPEALRVIEETFGYQREYMVEELVPLDAYTATENGYLMRYSSERDLDVVVPVAALDGMRAEIDGNPWPHTTFENLVRMELPAGEHEIAVILERTPVYLWGLVLSLVSPAVLLGGLVFIKKRDRDVKKHGQVTA
ncbi:MAG: 6-pyruvoyl-tetrahydropterin synthase-related protein [Bacillota bacterium]